MDKQKLTIAEYEKKYGYVDEHDRYWVPDQYGIYRRMFRLY